MVISLQTHLEAFRRMLRIRLVENAIAEDFRTNKIFSFYHSSAGQEAVGVGAGMALDKKDRIFGNHRSHAHYLGKGGNLYRMLCEIYGKADGCCKGYGGSMHMLDRSVGFAGSTPILGSIVPIAVGSAFEQKASNRMEMTLAFFGDGASEEGAVYESINLAAVLKLPIIFFAEDNLYAVNTPELSRRSPLFDRRKVVEGLGALYVRCNGNSFDSVYSTIGVCRAGLLNAKEARRPYFVHAVTFRHMAHSGPIMDESVRDLDTKDLRDATDPIKEIMTRLGGIDTDQLWKQIDTEIRQELARAKTAKEPVMACI